MRHIYVSQLRRLFLNSQITKIYQGGCSILKATSIRQIPLRSTIRPISSSHIIYNCINALKHESINLSTQSSVPQEPLFDQVNTLIETNHFDEIINTLKHSDATLNHAQLTTIISKLSTINKCNEVLSIFALYKKEITQDILLLELILKAAYQQDNYSLFEDLFNYYIQFPDASAKSFNLALKMFLRTNTELAKQILYQMIYSQYPMNERTLLDFLTVADKVSTFQTIKFVVELIKRSPNVPVSPAAYARLTKSYLRDGTGHDVNMLFEFLKERNVHKLSEVRIAFFLNGIEDKSMDEVWDEFKDIRETILSRQELLPHFYEEFYYEVHSRLTAQDLETFMEYLKQDKLFLTSVSQQHIIFQIRDESKLLAYLKDLRKQKLDIDQYIIRSIWSRLLKNNPDQGYMINEGFRQLALNSSHKFPWANELPKTLKMWTEKHSKEKQFVPYTFSNAEYWIYEQVNLFISRKEDLCIMNLLNDLLREGKKPTLPILQHILKGLVSLKSSQDHKVYELIHELYGNPPSSVDLLWLSKSIKEMRGKRRAALTCGNAIKDFELKHHGNLSYKDYLHLSSLATDSKRYDISVEYLSKARELIPREDFVERRNVYVLFLKTLQLRMDLENFILMMNLIVTESDGQPTSYTLKMVKEYKKSLMKKEKLEKEAKEQFEQKFDKIYPKLKEKYVARKVKLQETLRGIVTALEEWMNETLERK